MWRGRWLAGHALVLLFAGTFIALGFWQFGRHHEKQDKVSAARAEFAAPAPALGDTTEAGTRVEASGTYDAAHEVLLRNEPRGDEIGTDVLTPLQLSDGTAVLVDRGWLAGDAPTVPAPPSGSVTVRGIARASRALSSQDNAREVDGRLSVPRVDLAYIGADLPYELRDVWIEAQAQIPSSEPPALPEPPAPTSVNHMQYAIQWWLLALIPIIGWPIVLARRHKKGAR